MQDPLRVANHRLPVTAFFAGLATVTALGMLDLLSHVSIVGALLIGVFVAALAAPPRRVALVGLYALVWILVLGFEGRYWTLGHWIRMTLAVFGTGVGVAAAVSRDRHITALVRTAAVAEVAQRALIRPLATRFEEAEIAVRYLASADGALIGGDVYDVEPTPWGLRVLIADVCGHGLPAVDHASTIVFAFREAAHTYQSLADLVPIMNRSFARRSQSADFATCLMMQINDGEIEIVNCGHPDPLLISTHGIRWVETPLRCPPLGLDPQPSPQRIEAPAGSTLLVYTDGLVEARDRSGTFFDIEGCVASAFLERSVEDGIDALVAAVRRHAGRALRDDVVVMAIRLRSPVR